MWVCWQIATLSGIILGSFVPEELGLKFAIPLTFIAIVVQDFKKIDHVIVMITCEDILSTKGVFWCMYTSSYIRLSLYNRR